jgi:predicted DNA-binding transcriptional regulator AlpA
MRHREQPEMTTVNVVVGTERVTWMTGLSRTTIWRLERAGKFPQRLRLSSNRCGWLLDEVKTWIATRPRGMAG